MDQTTQWYIIHNGMEDLIIYKDVRMYECSLCVRVLQYKKETGNSHDLYTVAIKIHS